MSQRLETGRRREQDVYCMAPGRVRRKALREKLKSQSDVRRRCLNSRVQTFTKKLSQQLTTEDINWHFISNVKAGGEARWRAAGVAPLASLIRQPARGIAAHCRLLTAHFEQGGTLLHLSYRH